MLHENMCCGYSIEAPQRYTLKVPQRGAFNEYPQHMFSCRNKQNVMWKSPPI